MKYYLFCLILNFPFFHSNAQMPNDSVKRCDCSYKGRISKVNVNSWTGICHFRNFKLGEFDLGIDIEGCSWKDDTLKLKGVIYTNINITADGKELISSVKDVAILKCVAKGKKLKIQDTLATSDKNGRFSITTKVIADEYIVVVQKDKTGIVYSLLNFRRDE